MEYIKREIKQLEKEIQKLDAQRIKLVRRYNHFIDNGNKTKEIEYNGKLDDNQHAKRALFKQINKLQTKLVKG